MTHTHTHKQASKINRRVGAMVLPNARYLLKALFVLTTYVKENSAPGAEKAAVKMILRINSH